MNNISKDFTYISHRGLVPLYNSVSNKFGKFWILCGPNIYGVDDLRKRIGDYNTPWNIPTNPVFAMPELRCINDSLSDIMDQRAIELNEVAKSTNRRLGILWSGGIDSTAMLVAFIKNLSAADKQNIIVYLSTEIVVENYEFYRDIVKGNFEIQSSNLLKVNDELLTNVLLLHGDPADGIFGPGRSMIMPFFKNGKNKASWKDNFQDIIRYTVDLNPHSIDFPYTDLNDEWSHWYMNKLADNIESCVAKDFVKTVEDFWWWNYFNTKYECVPQQHVLIDYLDHYKAHISDENYNMYMNNIFYNTEKFQLWSFTNKDILYGDGSQTHKLAAKQYIYDFDKNENYFVNKRKKSSTKERHRYYVYPVCYSRNFDTYRYDDPEVADWLLDCLENYTG